MTARALATAVGRGTLDPEAVAEAALARLDERNPAINAICAVNPRLLEEAEAVRTRIGKGEELPLAGVPVVVKDNIWVDGLSVTQGSKLFADFVAPEDARSVALLRKAGALILGMGTCSEFACKGVTNTPLHGITRNPVDPQLTPGGSSGGPAAAVAAGLAPIAIGTDAGGSSRRPPAHVGVVGFKPTQDLIPYGPGFAEPVDGISVICPITRTVDDALLAMSVLAGLASTQFKAPRIGHAPSLGLDQACDIEVIEAMERLLDRLRLAGFETTQVRIDWPTATAGADVMPLQFSGLAALYGAKWKATPERFDPDIGAQVEAGLALDNRAVARARDASFRMRDTLRGVLTQYEFILCPTTPCPAWPVDRLGPERIAGSPATPRDHAAFTPQANHAGVPAITLPLPRPTGALPLGVQIIAGPNRDAALLAFARELEALMAQDNSEETGD